MTTEYAHIPVMPQEVLEYLQPAPGQIVVDATLGAAGHGRLLAQGVSPGGVFVGIDQDPAALAAAEKNLAECVPESEVFLLRGNFRDLDALLQSVGLGYVDRFLFDIGVSSPQLDDVSRGFSYSHDAPLDMRMDPDADIPTAADILATYSAAELTRVLADFGEEKWASRIAQFIVRRRAVEPVTTSSQLTELIKHAIPASARRSGGNPAKRTYQGLRIEVNGELEALQTGLEAAIRWLRPGGRLGVLDFHSLEDRLVKRVFAEGERACTCPPDLPVCVCGKRPYLEVLTRKALRPSAEEMAENPRAKSTKFRVAQKV